MLVSSVKAPAKGVGKWDIRDRRKENRKVILKMKMV